VTAAATGMLSWATGVALIPLNAKLDKGTSGWLRCCAHTPPS